MQPPVMTITSRKEKDRSNTLNFVSVQDTKFAHDSTDDVFDVYYL